MSRRVLALAAALVAALALGGCAQIPTDGPVHDGRVLGYDESDGYVRALPASPRSGATPIEIVRGFLEASSSAEDDYGVAREFLAPTAAASWNPGAGVTVYRAGDDFALKPVTRDEVTLSATSVASIDSEGVLTPRAPGTTTRATFGLTRAQGEWRIDRLPDGLYLTDYDVSRSYRSVNLYFLDPAQQVLVPDPVWVPSGPGVATTLVKRLLKGPSSWLAPGVTTAVPEGTALSGSVPVEAGVAKVDLSETALSATPKAREALSAQLVWTLAQVEDVQSVQVTVAGAPYKVPHAPSVQPRDSWQGYDPSALPSGALAYVVRKGRLGTLDGDSFSPVDGPIGSGRVPLVDPAVSPRADAVAGVSADGHVLLSGPLTGDLEPRLRGSQLVAPSWDSVPTAWVADRGASEPTVWLVPRDGEPVRVQIDELDKGPVTALRVSRDGTRVALVAGSAGESALYVGSVARGDGKKTPPHIEGLRRLAPTLTDITDVGWSTASVLAVLARQGRENLGVFLVDLDGQSVTALAPLPGMVSLAAAPRPLATLVATTDGTVWRLTGRKWVSTGPGRYPAYPG